ncbi:hypothetical protein K505DRAFT_343552 [Melanomma pulvis-pyrius CBS 109.77]|uniref:Uncharacterized protein n=1 Tax=Melanomma pulvis-pyrius CBS 109.77 TaxID=1314802 RepID=A0A6A6WS08_9PLEO|nr:hypothetical protein K505DRAFT_343552 [Melanomma pulvis-pyrius CBS 109.77]
MQAKKKRIEKRGDRERGAHQLGLQAAGSDVVQRLLASGLPGVVLPVELPEHPATGGCVSLEGVFDAGVFGEGVFGSVRASSGRAGMGTETAASRAPFEQEVPAGGAIMLEPVPPAERGVAAPGPSRRCAGRMDYISCGRAVEASRALDVWLGADGIASASIAGRELLRVEAGIRTGRIEEVPDSEEDEDEDEENEENEDRVGEEGKDVARSRQRTTPGLTSVL